MPAINTEAEDLNETEADIIDNNDPSNKLFAKIENRRREEIKKHIKQSISQKLVGMKM